MNEPGLHRRVLVIGYGNPIRGDDGFGPHVASLLAGQIEPAQATILTFQQLTPDLAELVAQHALTILIDAQSGDLPGTVHHLLIQPPEQAVHTFQHHITPEVLAGVTLALYGVGAEIHLFSVESDSFEIGEGLSPAVSGSAGTVVEQILELLQA